MKSLFWVLWVELKQSWIRTLALFVFSFSCGLLIIQSDRIHQEVSRLTNPIRWNAELAILPKGMSLDDLYLDVRSGQAHHFLPEALFDTTSSLVQGKIKLSAILPRKQNSQVILQYKGEKSLGWKWVSDNSTDIVIYEWQEQKDYFNQDWGNKVVSALFASGNQQDLIRLKDIIERKTVAQAFWVEDEFEKSQDQQEKIMSRLYQMEMLFGILLLAGLAVALNSLYQDLKTTINYLHEIGISRAKIFSFIFLLVSVFLLPLIFSIFFTTVHVLPWL